MATYQSRDEIIAAYKNLLRLEQSLHEALTDTEKNSDWQQVDQLISKQHELMERIDNQPNLDPLMDGENAEEVRHLLEQFSSLRQQNRQQLQTMIEQSRRQFESLDQAEKLMKHYLQAEKRFGPSMSRRFEQEI